MGIIGKSGECGGNSREIQGKLGENWGIVFPNGETEVPGGEINFPHIGDKGAK